MRTLRYNLRIVQSNHLRASAARTALLAMGLSGPLSGCGQMYPPLRADSSLPFGPAAGIKGGAL